MKEFRPRHVLAATDFSADSVLALRYAEAIASHCGSDFTLVHAHTFEPPLEFMSSQVDRLAAQVDRDRAALRQYIEQHTEAALGPEPAIRPFISLVEAPPTQAIIDEATRVNADLIVMGTHGRSGFNRLLMGSVAENVTRLATCPVLTVRRAGPNVDPVTAPVRLRRVLAPLNDTPAAMLAAETACALFRCMDGELTVLHIVEPGAPTPKAELPWIPEALRGRCSFRTEIRTGNAAEQIVRVASEQAADVVVIGAQHKPFLDATVFGSTTVRVMRHSPCPVLIVPAHPERG